MRPARLDTAPSSPPRRMLACLLLCTSIWLEPTHAAPTVVDDGGNPVTLAAPARRIVSLAPHITELLYAAGTGAFVVGASQYSDYPPAARKVPSVGAASALDLEKIITLKPDLVVAWHSGSSAAQIAKLRALAIPVFESEPRDFATVASSLERLGRLAGTETAGNAAAAAFRARIASLEASYRSRPPVRVFYQVWHKPLMTLNDAHLVSAALRLCGGQNIFGALPQLTPTVSREAVLALDPETIISAGGGAGELDSWRQFPQLTAVARNNLFRLDADLLSRAGPRILEGAGQLCRQLELARSRRQ